MSGAGGMRQVCSDTVKAQPSKYTTAVLGTPPARYIENITNEAVWGSALEVGLLSGVFKCEVVVLDSSRLTDTVHGTS